MKDFTILIFCFCSLHAAGQETLDREIFSQDSSANFFEIQAVVNQYYREHPGEKGEKVWRRREWFLEPRLYPSGELHNLALKTIKPYNKLMSGQNVNRGTHAHWSFLGPLNVNGSGYMPGIGRINCFIIHPSNANIIYIGASHGGIWKTTNGGTSWANTSPDIPLLAITDLAFDPNNANIIYALTGDGDAGPPSIRGHGHTTCGTASIGVIKSADGGNTWYPTGPGFGYPTVIVPTALLINPNSADTQFVTTLSHVFRTYDNWNSHDTLNFGAYDIEYHPTDTKIMYCSGSYWIARSTNRGLSWSAVTDSDFDIIIDTIALRIELAVTPDFPSAVYALVGGNKLNTTMAIFKSLSAGANNTWTIQNSTDELLDGQTYYNNSLTVKDTDHNDVFAAGVWTRRSTNSGLAWDTINGPDNFKIHVDVHEMQYRNGVLYIASDGGLYKSADNGDTWTDLWAGLGITEIYRISGTPQNPNLHYCGSQDNGIMKWSGSTTFNLEISGDGMFTQINYMNSDTVFGCVQNGDCHRSVDGYQNWDVMTISAKPGAWVAPMILDPVYPQIIFVARDSIFRSNNSGSNGSWMYLGQPDTSVNCMRQGTNNRNRLYASRLGKIYRTDNALVNSAPATWVNITSGLPNLFITDIAVDPDNANEVYVCFSGYTDGVKVYYSANSGNSGQWTNITGSLPNVPVNCIEFHDNGFDGLYVGTDIGVFYRDDNLGDWIYYSNNLPVTIVTDLYINTTSNKISAGTYGRGLWQADLYIGCDETLTLGPGNLGGVRHYSVSNWILSTHDYNPDLGTNIHYNAGNYIDLKPGFEVSGLGYFEGKIGPCPPPFTEDLIAPPYANRPFIFTEETHEKLLRSD
jgi:hypothetical protein